MRNALSCRSFSYSRKIQLLVVNINFVLCYAIVDFPVASSIPTVVLPCLVMLPSICYKLFSYSAFVARNANHPPPPAASPPPLDPGKTARAACLHYCREYFSKPNVVHNQSIILLSNDGPS